MPMTQRQLEQVEHDYRDVVDPKRWKVIACERHFTRDGLRHAADKCGVCAASFLPGESVKIITWQDRGWPDSISLRYLKAAVCRNGVACRRHAGLE